MDWVYLFGPSAFQVAAGFVIAKLFDLLSETRQDRRLRLQLAAEKERLELQHRNELRKRLFESKFDTALRLTRLLHGSVETINTQMLLHVASYSEGKVDVEAFRQLRDTAFDRVQVALREGEDAAAIMELLYSGVSLGDLPHQNALFTLNAAWRKFLQAQSEFLTWLETQRATLPPRLPTADLAAKDAELSHRMQEMRAQAGELLTLSANYGESVSKSIRMLGDALEV
jgi:hypothetical protein